MYIVGTADNWLYALKCIKHYYKVKPLFDQLISGDISKLQDVSYLLFGVN